MPNRALLVAIENYPNAMGLFSRTLSGTHDAAKAFYRWLVDVKKLSYDSIFVCSDGSVHDPNHPASSQLPDGSSTALIAGATRPEIIRAIMSIIAVGRDNTSEFYFFFSGHGFAYQVSQYQLGMDVLLTHEFHKADDSGAACIKLGELRTRFYLSLGGRDHYHFIDACRNVISEGAIQVLDLGIAPRTAQLGCPTMYTLYSVKYGESAPVNAKFPDALNLGLVGSGHAKGWMGGEMFVKFDLLCQYVDDQSNPPHVDSRREGNGNGNLLKLLPASVLSECKVIVDAARPDDRFTLETTAGTMSRQDSFTGSSFSIKLEPNDRTYSFRLTASGQQYEMYDPPPSVMLDLYSSCTLKFRPVTGIFTPLSPPQGRGATVSLTFAPPATLEGQMPDWKIQLEDLQTGEVESPEATSGGDIQVRAGSFVARLKEDGVTAVRRYIRVKPGATERVDLLHRESTPMEKAILSAVNADPKGTIANFSETLGPTAHWNLQLWLAYIGAAHIMKRPDMYYKLGRIPLVSLDSISTNGSAVLFLVVSDRGTPNIAAHRNSDVTWTQMMPVGNVPNLYQGMLTLEHGWTLLSIALPNLPPLTFASCALPNRVGLFVFAPDVSGRLGAQQFLLPLAHLHNNLPYVEEWWDHGPASNLKLVGLISLAQQRFALRKPVPPDAGNMYDIWKKLFETKWTDPVLGLIALYDVVRQGTREKSPYSIESVLNNLLTYFPELPDVAILTRLLGMSPEPPREGVPLFLDGFLASGQAGKSALPISRLDFNSAYTSWRDAVEG